MASDYEYKPLDLGRNSIRLVQILKGDANQPIECTLFESLLDPGEGIPYEALSYVWGTEESADKIWVNGRPFNVTENLFQALLALRQPDHDRLLWIDAICIDQSHAAERGHQVRQMNRVYQTADNVVIWLGTGNDQIDQLFYWMCRLDQDIVAFSSLRTKVEVQTWAQHWQLLLWKSNKEFPPDDLITTFEEVLRREWFSRIWVLQEAALARTATVTCGQNSVSSRTFVIMTTLLEIECSKSAQSRLDIMPGPLRSGVNSWWRGPLSQDLDSLLRRFAKSKATDPRDIIYALLGLSADASKSDVLRPDYELSLEETVQHTVLYLLRRRRYLEDFRVPADLPIWDIDQLLVALEDLPQHVFTWAVDRRKATLITSFPSTGEDAQRLQSMDELIRGTAWPSVDIMGIHPSLFDLMLQYRELYRVTSGSDGSWLVPAIAANHRGAAGIGSLLPRSNEVDTEDGSFNMDSSIFCITKRGEAATVEVILNHPNFERFTLDNDVIASQVTAARGGAQTLAVFLDQSTKIHTWSWSEGRWFFNKGAPVTRRTLAGMFRDVTYALASLGQTDPLRILVDASPGLENMRCRGFRSLLGIAAESNNATMAAMLLDQGADIESTDWRTPFATPLWIAASQGHVETVKTLASRGANLEFIAGGSSGLFTPLWIAASEGFEEVVLVLASMGANINVSAWNYDRMVTAVGIAASKLHMGVLQVLAERGAEMGELDEELRGQLRSAAG